MVRAEAAPAMSNRTVLVVEDEVLIRLLICDVLRDMGLRVVEAANADEALTYLKIDPNVRLVFSDVRMPGSMDGIGLARRLKTDFPQIEVVLASGHLQAGDLDEATYLVAKPYPLEETAARIVAILDKTSTA
jgi:CheY-like chemotaxis protein